MALRVITSPTQPKLRVTTNPGGMQNGANPQRTAPAQTIQQTAPAQRIQPAAPAQFYQPAAPVVQAPTAAEVAAAAESVRRAAEAEATRQREARRATAQTNLNASVQSNKNKLTVKSIIAKPRLSVRASAIPKIKVPEMSIYDRAYAKAYEEALKNFDSKTSRKDGNFFADIWDKVSFGQDRRTVAAREYAAKEAQRIADQSVKDYDSKLNGFISEQAKRRAAIENAKFGSQVDFDKAVAEYSQWESEQVNNLEASRAIITAQLEAYGERSQKPLSTVAGRAAAFASTLPQKLEDNPIWKYTLGSGDRNIPSVASIIPRAVNWIGNINTNNRNIYVSGGEVKNRLKTNENAWQSTLNQRNFNIRPWVDRELSKDEKEKMFGAEASKRAKYWNETKKIKDQKLKSREYWIDTLYQDYNRTHRFWNSTLEFAADPTNLVTEGAKVAKGLGWLEKSSELGRATKATSWAFNAADRAAEVVSTIKSNKAINWLLSEAKTPTDKLHDAIKIAKTEQATIQATLLTEIKRLNSVLDEGARLDLSVFDDLKRLSDDDAAVLQRMTNGKFATKDRLALVGRDMKPIREHLERVAAKWDEFSEKMKAADGVINSRFGAGKKFYSPHTKWLDGAGLDLDSYNFKLKKKSRKIQTADDMYAGMVDRYFVSDFDKVYGDQMSEFTRQRDEYKGIYDLMMHKNREKISEAYGKTKTPYQRAKRLVGAPMRFWKKSVLKYRPAWAVNNAIYNVQGAALAGGASAVAEQVKMLNPRYWRKAMSESRQYFGSNLGKEIGKGKIAKFHAGLEDWSRVAAGRALMKKGKEIPEAIKRVDKYLFNYTTKNWERPIKAVLPFWQFQKNVAKAAAQMPFDRPYAASTYGRFDRYQKEQFDKEFETVIPQLKEMGYSDDEIEAIRIDNKKYFKDKLKIGNKWINTPFNAFSEKGLTSFGLNPYLSAPGEVAASKDSFGRPIQHATFINRLLSKFPQADLIKQYLSKPTKTAWIGKPGSEGYGLSKEMQGFDKSSSNYSAALDPRAKLKQNTAAFFGMPRSMEFDKNKLLKNKALEKAAKDYFALSVDGKEFDQLDAERQDIFDKYGITEGEFYAGILAKYDSANTKRIKGMKENARKMNESLFDEYAKQPVGTRSTWAVNKIRELTASGYFDNNPFLRSFKFVTPAVVAKTDKRTAYLKAKQSGDWSEYSKKYGTTKSQKSIDREKALATGDWSEYRRKYGVNQSQKSKDREYAVATGNWSGYRERYGTKSTPYSYAGKFFKTADSMQKYIDGEFWRRYDSSDKETKKRMLAEHPEYNTRQNWTTADWNAWRSSRTAEQRNKINSNANLAGTVVAMRGRTYAGAKAFQNKKINTRRYTKINWRLPA